MEGKPVSPSELLAPETAAYYRNAMRVLSDAGVPFLVGGAYAFQRYTGIVRHTKDFDLFVKEVDIERALRAMEGAGYRTEMPFPHWLAKAYCVGEDFVDLIFKSGNGVSTVDDAWFDRSVEDEVLGVPTLICAPEEMVWTKAFIMERERYDGADVVHLLRGSAERINWQRMLYLFGPFWRVLLSHLVLFGFIYPSERGRIPDEVFQELTRRLQEERNSPAPNSKVCFGTLLSRQQYLIDIEEWGFEDARLQPRGEMTGEQIEQWTEGIKVDGFGKE
ncbi:MAG TPA: hypothetical protein VFG50_08560 [Rhodothermales bacterium]|nr:hypothetical protein [Rhodothermales bacterium]